MLLSYIKSVNKIDVNLHTKNAFWKHMARFKPS